MNQATNVVDWRYFEEARAELGEGFLKILGYFREDGAKSIEQIEQAMRTQDTAALVIPAHTLKGESRQFGAEMLADCAEEIEMAARRCIEIGEFPDNLIPDVVKLRELWASTIEAFDEELSPLMKRKPAGDNAAQGGFGRAGY